jgi:hypothetical protein
MLCLPRHGLAQDVDPLSLPAADEQAPQKTAPRALRAYVEGVAGRIWQRSGLPDQTATRASLDLNYSARWTPQWRLGLSNRTDDIHPVTAGVASTLNSVREAFVGWEDAAGSSSLQFGRVNLRHGTAYGYNPTDFFRDGTVRALTTPDPLALRENRLGTVVVAGQQLSSDGAMAFALAPKLRDTPNQRSFSLDLGATNHSDRALLSASLRASDRVSGEVLAFYERGKGLQLGANTTALLSDRAVAFAEGSGGRGVGLLSESLGGVPARQTRVRAAAGATLTAPGRLEITVEGEYNGFAPTKNERDAAARALGAAAFGALLQQAQLRQDLAARRALLLYVVQRGGMFKGLDITALLRVNAEDRSRFAWLEFRYHLARVDIALQVQSNDGRALSEYGALPNRAAAQVLTALYF